MTTKTKKPASKKQAYTIEDLKQRQEREGFSHGYLGHEVRGACGGKTIDEEVMAFLQEAGYDQDDAYQALNSRNGRHMGDALMDAAPSELRERVIENLWPSPAAMYKDFGTTKRETKLRAQFAARTR